jgi:hypothetical protein
VVGNSSDDPFAIDVAFAVGQREDIADIISMKTFANSEFCPRFISDERDFSRIGSKLDGKTVVIVSTSSRVVSRQTLAMRTLLIARAAKENGAATWCWWSRTSTTAPRTAGRAATSARRCSSATKRISRSSTASRSRPSSTRRC